MPGSHPPRPITAPSSPHPHPADQPRLIRRWPDERWGSLGFGRCGSHARLHDGLFGGYFAAALATCTVGNRFTSYLTAAAVVIRIADNRFIRYFAAVACATDTGDIRYFTAVASATHIGDNRSTRNLTATACIVCIRSARNLIPARSASNCFTRNLASRLATSGLVTKAASANRLATGNTVANRVGTSSFVSSASTHRVIGNPLDRTVRNRLDPTVRSRRRLSTHRPPGSAWHPHFPPLPGAPSGAPRLACSV
ncbi:hypothetical protein G3I59_06170 [Amycolatopsis rubida]|uniref:Uncharacterized protein n=1 Tax=Amycolatopsis rubida TaxID=112413 RepID=A0ABX0BID6_9PSEU|nr:MULTISPECIES: hypothetical protein [Amycolatopsis]MYW90215.1 hypothetical protein [Amycolatopsis rubida]NEC55192.1 hypothetical protein [Amycolatopsis rubida]